MISNAEFERFFVLYEENNRLQQETNNKLTAILDKLTATLPSAGSTDIDFEALANEMSTNMFQNLTH